MTPGKHLPVAFSLLLIAALLAACAGQQATPTVVPVSPTTAPVPPTAPPPTAAAPATTAAAQPQPHQPRPDAPPYALRGPYAVGVRDFVLEATKEVTRPLTVSVWYPALNPEKLPEAITYELGFPTNAQPNFTIAGQALADAAPDLSGGPYPLLVHTHAGWTFRQDMVYLMEHLASQGFVVMAAGHEDNWGMLMENFYKSEISRPREVSNEIDFAEALTAAGGELAGLIDTEHVAVSGWSIGGQVALEKAGARLNLVEQQKNYCATMRDLDIRCSFYATPITEMAELAGLEALPEGDWPDWSDARVDAIVLFEPSEGSLGALPVAVQTPVLLIEGTIDDPGYGWDGIASAEKTAAILENAGHVVFMNNCTAQPGMSEGGFHGVCSDPVWDVDRVHDLVNHFVTAFLKAEFQDDAEAAKALAPENVTFTGVEYQTTAYGAPTAPAEPQAPQGLRPDAPEYAKRGPYPVGYKSVVIGEDTDRPLQAGLWYPALNPQGLKEEVTYSVTPKIPVERTNGPFVVYGHALQDAAVDAAAAPYPLVIFSHGFSVNAPWYNALIENYASHGFVVLAPDHVEKFDPEWSEIANASIDRPRDIKQTLDYAEQINAPAGDMAGLIDMEHVAVVGHSYGGYTALAAAGAQYDLDAFNTRCAQLPADDPLTFLCAPLVPKEEAMAARAGLDTMPDGLWPSLGDPRVTAIVTMAGDSYLFDKAGLSKITIPMLAIGGTADTATPYDWGSRPSYDNASSAKKALVTLEGAEHTVSMVSCDNMPWVKETDFYQWICLDPVWDKDRVQDLIHHFSTAFLLDTLKGDTKAATALAPENVSFPGIKYETTAYGAAKPPAEPPAPQGLRPDAPEFAKRGPFPVGYQSLVIGEDTDRPLQAGLWYPALNPMGLEEEITYSTTPKIPVDQTAGPFVVAGHALQDAEVDAASGPYPLVVFSPGFACNAPWYNTLIENYASHGFVVLAPEHVEQFDPEWSDLAPASIDRPQDIKQTLDYAEAINAAGGDMAGLIDMQHVAVVGHSYGGYTSLAMAGAQYDLNAYNARCAQVSPEVYAVVCEPLVPKEADMAARAGLDPLPEGLWPSFGDPRVTAIVPIAGDSYFFDKAGLAKITVPMMAIGGSADTGTPYEWGSKPSYEYASSAKKALVTLEAAEHTISMGPCDNMPWMKETDFYQWICLDPVWDKDRGLDLINHFSTAFLLDTLKGDEAAAKALAPENVTFPGVKYDATGYAAAP